MDDTEREDIMIMARLATIDSDPLSLLTEIPRVFDDPTVHLTVESVPRFEQEEPLSLDRFETDIELVERGSERFHDALRRSGLVFSMEQYYLQNYRELRKHENRICVRIHHGIMTKAYGNLERADLLQRTPHEDELDQYPNGFDAQAVASDVELFYRACAEGRHPVAFRKYGYPRFDRIDRLQKDDATPLLPPASQERFAQDSDTFRIIYAPTHKDDDVTELFPFSDFDIGRLRGFLRDNDMNLYIRMHPLEEDLDLYDEVIDGETIHYAGRDFSSAPSEILPYFDVLVTDYSSIYTDFLPFDRPIIFVQDNYERYSEKRGLAFDYDLYFPGPKVDSLKGFTDSLLDCQAGEDSHAAEREFVRKTFFAARDQPFLESVVADFDDRLQVPIAG